MQPMSRYLGDVMFWIVILLFLPAILGALKLEGLLAPVQGMVDKLLDIVPNIFSAVLIGCVGWLLAKVLRGLVTNLLISAGADKLADKAGIESQIKVSGLIGTVVFIFVFVPTLISALDALKIESVSKPASDMLGQFLSSVPHIVAATVILLIAFYVARFAAILISRLLESLGADSLPEMMGLSKVFSGALRPSSLAASLLMFFAMLFATVEAANRLGFLHVSDIVTDFIEFGGRVLLGVVILTIGFWLAGLARRAILQANDQNNFLAQIAQFAIVGLVLAMGLGAMGIADEIVQIAFLLTLGSVAVAVALAFGLGGREAAGKLLERWLKKLTRE